MNKQSKKTQIYQIVLYIAVTWSLSIVFFSGTLHENWTALILCLKLQTFVLESGPKKLSLCHGLRKRHKTLSFYIWLSSWETNFCCSFLRKILESWTCFGHRKRCFLLKSFISAPRSSFENLQTEFVLTFCQFEMKVSLKKYQMNPMFWTRLSKDCSR